MNGYSSWGALSNQGFAGVIMLIDFKKGQAHHFTYANWSFNSWKYMNLFLNLEEAFVLLLSRIDFSAAVVFNDKCVDMLWLHAWVVLFNN